MVEYQEGKKSSGAIIGVAIIAIAGAVGATYYLTKKASAATTSTVTSTITSTVTSTGQILTTINWSVSPTSLPQTGGTLTFTLQALDQNGNPMSGQLFSLLEYEPGVPSQTVGNFPVTNPQGQSQLLLNVPPNDSNSSIPLTFTLGGV
ncbi:MAG: hypothetical protein QXP38_00670 [Nitrososphaerota archaeon]